jgi:nitrite reductase/ring-hydroxylating ferredoxin subunit
MANTLDDAPRGDLAAPADAHPQRVGRRPRRQQWREEFPYFWREDDLVTRRDTLRFLVAGSGALLVATGALAAAGTLATPATAQAVPIARVDELGPNEWKVFNFPDQYAQGILINLPSKGLVAYSDVCTHLSCAVIYQGDGKHLYCPCHDGLFDAASGAVLAGPPVRPLPLITLRISEGVIYAVQEVQR